MTMSDPVYQRHIVTRNDTHVCTRNGQQSVPVPFGSLSAQSGQRLAALLERALAEYLREPLGICASQIGRILAGEWANAFGDIGASRPDCAAQDRHAAKQRRHSRC